MSALIVVWADPGVSTGWCIVRVPIARLLAVGQVGSTAEQWFKLGEYRSANTSVAVDGFLGIGRRAWEASNEGDVVVLGCEGFILRMQSTDPDLLEPVRFLAVMHDRLRGTGVGVEVQMPSEAKQTITDARLRMWGLYREGNGHGRDAQRHALLFLRRFAGQAPLRKRVGCTG